jgi:DHA1 family bicyclomycin/chloramphenicol resistance-like MFS transporter
VEIDICVPSFPEIQNAFGISSFAVEFILGINLLTHCVGGLVAGNLGDKYGRKPVILFGLALFIFGSLTCALSESYCALLVGRFIQGIGISCPSVLAYVIIPDAYDIKTHQKLLGLLNFFSTLAMAVAPIIGSYATLLFGWRGNFYLLLFLGIVCYVLGYFFLPTAVKNNNVSLGLSEYAKILKNKKAIHYVFTICSFVIGYWVFIAMAPLLYINDLGVKLEHFGWYQGSLAAIFAIVSLSSEKLYSLFGVKKCFEGGIALVVLALASILALLFAEVKNPLLITSALAILSAGIICPVNILCPYSFKAIAPSEKGKLNALIALVKYGSISLLVQTTSFFYNRSFLAVGLTIFATIVVALFFCARLLKMDNIFEEA